MDDPRSDCPGQEGGHVCKVPIEWAKCARPTVVLQVLVREGILAAVPRQRMRGQARHGGATDLSSVPTLRTSAEPPLPPNPCRWPGPCVDTCPGCLRRR